MNNAIYLYKSNKKADTIYCVWRYGIEMIIHIIKRDGRKVPFNIEKIANAIFKAAQARGGTDFNVAMDVAVEVCRLYEDRTPEKLQLLKRYRILSRKFLLKKATHRQQRHIFSIVTSVHAHVR